MSSPTGEFAELLVREGGPATSEHPARPVNERGLRANRRLEGKLAICQISATVEHGRNGRGACAPAWIYRTKMKLLASLARLTRRSEEAGRGRERGAAPEAAAASP